MRNDGLFDGTDTLISPRSFSFPGSPPVIDMPAPPVAHGCPAVSEALRNKIFAEHGDLAFRQLRGEITEKEAARLRYVRWQVDQITAIPESADSAFRRHLARLRELGAEVSKFVELADRIQRKSRKRRPENGAC